MKRIFLSFVAFLFSTLCFSSSDYDVLCYHDVVKSGVEIKFQDDIDIKQLSSHFSWLKENGYTVVSIDDLLLARKGEKSLPDKSVLLTFDDGYKSFYREVFPLLKAFNYPATLAVVGSWLMTPDGATVRYGNVDVARSRFISTDELAVMAKSGLVEVASHTYDMHKGVLGNPYGNEMPAATTRIYDTSSGSYESDQDYLLRVRSDLQRNSDFIESVTGKRPRVMVWPYGRYSGFLQTVGRDLGMEIDMSLDDGVNKIDDKESSVRRHFVLNNPSAFEIAWTLKSKPKSVMRLMHVDLDYIYDQNAEQQEKNLGLLLERIKESGVNTVFLQAFSDNDASGVAKSLYFKNRHLPVKADLFNRVSWQIGTRTQARVFAWLPLMAFVPDENNPVGQQVVKSSNGSPGVGYIRLSPFSEDARQYIKEIYEDLGKYTYFSGLIIHDDAALSDFEDSSDHAMTYYENRLGLPRDIDQIRSDKNLFEKWTKAKTEHLSWFAKEVKTAAEVHRKPLKLARNYYAEPIMNPVAEEWFSQSLDDALKNFDWVAIMAMPYMEKVPNGMDWLKRMVSIVKGKPGGTDKVVFELQAKDWNTGKNIENSELVEWMHMLRVNGANNFGYYPDNPFENHPDVSIIKKEISRSTVIQ